VAAFKEQMASQEAGLAAVVDKQRSGAPFLTFAALTGE